jgi:hypothetical protein
VPPQFQSFPSLTNNASAQIFPPKSITLGVHYNELAKAYSFEVTGEEAVINDALSGNPLVVVFYGKEHYALPFSRQINGQTLTFSKITSSDPVFPFMLQHTETGST